MYLLNEKSEKKRTFCDTTYAYNNAMNTPLTIVPLAGVIHNTIETCFKRVMAMNN